MGELFHFGKVGAEIGMVAKNICFRQATVFQRVIERGRRIGTPWQRDCTRVGKSGTQSCRPLNPPMMTLVFAALVALITYFLYVAIVDLKEVG